ncbi:hypothetical protein AYI69_g9935, partial [Smittium culicis]
MESLNTVCRMVRRKDWITSIDLSDAFLHILIEKSSIKLLNFTWNSQNYRFRVLPFGLSESTGVHESTSPCSEMGKNERNTHKCIFRRSNHLSIFQGRIRNKDKIGYEEAIEVGILNKFRKIELNPITIDSSSGDEDKFTTHELGDTKRKGQGPSKRSGTPDKAQENKHQKPSFFPRESSSYDSGPLAWSIDDNKTVRAKKFITIQDQGLELRNTINNSITAELSVMEGQFTR